MKTQYHKLVALVIALFCWVMYVGAEPTTPSVGGSGVSSSGPTSVTPSPVIDPNSLVSEASEGLKMFRSVPAFKSWAVRRVRYLSLDFESPVLADSSGRGYGWNYNDSSPSIEGMNDTIASAKVSFRITDQGRIATTVSYMDDDQALFEGKATFWPWENQKTGDWMIPPDFGPQVEIAQNIRIALPEIGEMQIVLNSSSEKIYVNRDPFTGMFEIPRRAIGKDGVFILSPIGSYNSEDRFAISISTGYQVPIKQLTGKVKSSMANTVILHQVGVININPKSVYGSGNDLLIEVTYTEAEAKVVINPVTSEGEVADSITIIDVETGESRDFAVDPKGLGLKSIEFDFPEGRFHIYANWRYFRDNSLEDYPWWIYGKG